MSALSSYSKQMGTLNTVFTGSSFSSQPLASIAELQIAHSLSSLSLTDSQKSGSLANNTYTYGSSEYVPSSAIRAIFERFFQENDHLKIPGSSLIPKNDPSLLYINSGMAPLKPFFKGEKTPPHPLLCNTQLCVRTGDIDDVGDMHHLTSFQMLGSWSINGYGKQKAIQLAYDLLINVFKYPKEKIYMTVYGGDLNQNIPFDQESYDHWIAVGVDPSHIVVLGEDNFWGPAGDTGPCGPCTEVFYEVDNPAFPPYEPGHPETFDTKNRYVEIWNAGVFMEYNKEEDGSLSSLPIKSVDTGSGLERMTMNMNQLKSVYETDCFTSIISQIHTLTGDFRLPEPSIRMLADHFRTITFLLGEDVKPGAIGREYIPRKLIRKCMSTLFAAGLTSFDAKPILHRILDNLVSDFPHLAEKRDVIINVFETEVNSFKKTLSLACKAMEKKLPKDGSVFSGTDSFAIYSSHGLPLSMQEAYLTAKGWSIDKIAYDRAASAHRENSKK